MKKLKIFTIIFALILSFTACQDKEAAFDEQYDLGIKYLTDGNYEEAIIAFEAAIEIDSKNPNAYIKLADVYIEMGDEEKAIEVIEDGLTMLPDNKKLIKKRETIISVSLSGEVTTGIWDNIIKGGETEPEATTVSEAETKKAPMSPYSNEFFTEDWIRPEEWTINGIPFWEASKDDIKAIYNVESENSTNAFGKNFGWEPEFGMTFYAWWQPDIETIINQKHNITTKSTREEVMRAIGLTDKGFTGNGITIRDEETGAGLEILQIYQEAEEEGFNPMPSCNILYLTYYNSTVYPKIIFYFEAETDKLYEAYLYK